MGNSPIVSATLDAVPLRSMVQDSSVIGDTNSIIESIRQHAKRLDMCRARLLDEEEVNARGRPLLPEACVRRLVTIVLMLGHDVRHVRDPRSGRRDGLLGAVLTGLYADVIEVSTEDNNAGACHAVLELAHCDNAVEHGVPASRGLLRRFAEPAHLATYILPCVVAVEDGRELAILWLRTTSTADMIPRGAQVLLDLVDLMKEAFLETYEGALLASGDEG
ncbi:hypothetical protein HG530_000158 [Fusarium avenaceum]|nr:hypothetical protein HG530_000158 [Fusarium avenaceum]